MKFWISAFFFQYILFFTFFSFFVPFSSLFYFSKGSSRKRDMRIRIYSYLQKKDVSKGSCYYDQISLILFPSVFGFSRTQYPLGGQEVERGGRIVQICTLLVGWLVCYPVSWLVRFCPSIVGCRSFIPIRAVSRFSSS